MLKRKPIVVVGSINLDLVATAGKIPASGETLIGTDFQVHPGGKGANQAVAIARLGYPVSMVGKVGSDPFGAELKMHLQRAGVDISGVATQTGSSGAALIVVSAQGENSIVVVPAANSAVTVEYLEDNLATIRQAGIVLTQLEIPIDTVDYLSSVCAREGIPLLLDPAPAAELPPDVLRQADWFTPNETEAAFYAKKSGRFGLTEAGETARSLIEMGCRSVALKMGSKGVQLASHLSAPEFVPAFSVQAVDTTAAGDAFNGAFAVGLMMGKSARESATFASAVAAVSVTRVGAQPSMPTMAEVQAFMTEHSFELPMDVSN